VDQCNNSVQVPVKTLIKLSELALRTEQPVDTLNDLLAKHVVEDQMS